MFVLWPLVMCDVMCESLINASISLCFHVETRPENVWPDSSRDFVFLSKESLPVFAEHPKQTH